MFDANYPVHFVVADSNDTYYTDSGLQLDLNQRIALELGSGWENILFLNDGPRVYNRKGEHLEEYTKSSWTKTPKDICRTKLLKALSESKQRNRTAVIADLTAFCNLMKGEEGSLQKLTEAVSNDRGILILLIPQTVDQALYHLTNPNGLFFQGGNNTVCPKLEYLSSSCDELFQNLRTCDQFKFMSELTVDVCRSMLICAILEQREIFPDSHDISDCAEVLCSLCTNSGFRQYTSMMKSLSDTPKFSDVFSWLCQSKNLENLFKLSEKIQKERNGRSITATIEALAGKPNKLQLIRRSNPLILDLCSISYPPPWFSEPDIKSAQELGRVQEKAFYPRATPQNDAIFSWLRDLIKAYKDSLTLKDEQHTRNVMHVICFAADKLYANDEAANTWLANHKEALQMWLTLSLKIVQERKILTEQEELLKENTSVALHHITKEQRYTVEAWQNLYDSATASVTPMLNHQEEITSAQVSKILEHMKELSVKTAEIVKELKSVQAVESPSKNETVHSEISAAPKLVTEAPPRIKQTISENIPSVQQDTVQKAKQPEIPAVDPEKEKLRQKRMAEILKNRAGET